MALLQISEPGMSPPPHQKRLSVGIDLGTTNSLVATVRNGKAETLPDTAGEHLLPSIVNYTIDAVVVGSQAITSLTQDPANTINSVKRMLGRSLDDLKLRYPHLPYRFTASQFGLPIIKTSAGDKNPIQVSADILQTLITRAEDTLQGNLEGIVITVPAYFDDAQRQATKDAAKLIGVKVLRLLNEPTAAAIAYGLDSKQQGVIAVYDLGGGTFDVSILALRQGVFEVLATGGDTALGGDDFDQALAEWLSLQSGISFTQAEQHRYLLGVAKQLKTALSTENSVPISLGSWQGEITRAQFSQLIKPFIKRTLMTCRRALQDAAITVDDIDNIILVGGSTRVPAVRESIADYFNKLPLVSIDPDKVVAIGAALQADILVGNKPEDDLLLLDVIPLSLGLETMGGIVEKIIPRNCTIPIAKAQEFTTFKDGQTAMLLHVLQGERELVADCRSLARFTLHGLPSIPAGMAHIKVIFQVDADGLLTVNAAEETSGIQASIDVKPSYGLSDHEIAKMITESISYAKEDQTKRQLAERKIDSLRLLEILKPAIMHDSVLLSETEKQAIEQAITQLERVNEGNEIKAIDLALTHLDELTQPFAARRMNLSIKRALTGHSVDDI